MSALVMQRGCEVCIENKEIIQQLREENARLQEENARLNEKVRLLEVHIQELERRLAKYENAHTPPSIRRGFFGNGKSEEKNNEEKKKPGRKEGHEGTTRPVPEPDRWIDVTLDKSPCCDAKLGSPSKTEMKIIEEIPEPQPVIVTGFRIAHYECPCCGKEVVATHPDCPAEGRFGKNVLATVTLLKYGSRLPLRKICEVLSQYHNLDVKPATVLDFTRRVSGKLRGEYEKVIQRVRKAGVLYVDETGIYVNGKNFWTWGFVTENETLIVVRKSRSKKVLKEILGEDFKGVIVCDGWRSYSSFTNGLQRCWSHLLRELRELAENFPQASDLCHAMRNLYYKLKKAVSENPPPQERDRLHRNALTKLRWWINKEYTEPEINKMLAKIRRGLKHWLTFLLIPGVEPTNNRAERALREHVVQRKIMGTLRNSKGTTIYETMMTMIATWKQQGLNPYTMMKQSL